MVLKLKLNFDCLCHYVRCVAPEKTVSAPSGLVLLVGCCDRGQRLLLLVGLLDQLNVEAE
jgi:hypothetical protein